MKLTKVLSVLLLVALLFAACSAGQFDKNIAGKPFIYEKEGAGGDFTIYFGEDGTFNYYEGSFSSHIGMGTYTVDGDVVTMTGDKVSRIDPDTNEAYEYEMTFRFRITDEGIAFIQEGSDNFIYVKLPDGARFFVTEIGEE